MGIERRFRRQNNLAGLRAQLADKEKEIYMLAQQQDMQKVYFDEVAKISTALKDILMRELKLDEEDVMKMLDAELDTTEAAEIDEVIKSEKVDAPSIEIVDENEIPEVEELISEVEKPIKETNQGKEVPDLVEPKKKAPAKAKKTTKKKESKE